jgi:hypothetical protein
MKSIDLRHLPIPNFGLFDINAPEKLLRYFDILAQRNIMRILDEIHQPDRRALDRMVFDILGLTAGEREAVYKALVALVQARLKKARSV